MISEKVIENEMHLLGTNRVGEKAKRGNLGEEDAKCGLYLKRVSLGEVDTNSGNSELHKMLRQEVSELRDT